MENRVFFLWWIELPVERFRLPKSTTRGKRENYVILLSIRPWLRPFCQVKWVDV